MQNDLISSIEYNRGWHDAIEMALKESYKIYHYGDVLSVVQEETLIGLGMSVSPVTHEKCDDAISRTAVLNTLDSMDKALDENRTIEEYKELLRECYEQLSPVSVAEKTPMIEKSNFDPKQYRFDLLSAYECGRNSVAEKVGRWIVEDDDIGNDNIYCKCSNCGKGDEHAKGQEVPYCWWCGARMAESEE